MLGSARRLVPALALAVLPSLAQAGCSRRAEAPPPPPVVDAAPDRPALPAPTSTDAGLEQAIDVPAGAPPDAAAPPRAHVHKSAPSRLASGAFRLEGSISRADAETVLRGVRAKLDACYETEHGKSPLLAGRVTFRLSIDNRGRVPLAEVLTSTLGGGDPELCMVEALRDLKFPPSPTGGESTLSFPMTFGR